jgi:thiol-disulfide isomerase/thioredoxin
MSGMTRFFLLAVWLLILPAVSGDVRGQNTKQVKLRGQLVCSLCWFEADRKSTPYGTPADIQCAKDCAEKGIPSALAVKDGDDFRLYVVSTGKIKRTKDEWLDYVGKQAEVGGRIKRNGEKDYIEIDELRILPDEVAQSNKLIGTEVDLALKDLFGVEQKLSSYRGKILVLNFWATWCIPCRKEMPDLAAVQNEYAAFGVQTLGASADDLAERVKVVRFIKEAGVNFPVFLGATTADMSKLGVGPALPATLIIGRDGKVLFLKNAPITRTELKKELDRLLASGLQAIAANEKSKPHNPVDSSLVPS